MMITSIVQRCSEVLGKSIEKVVPLSGGDINEAYLLQCAKDRYFLKFNTGKKAKALLASEVKGLNCLSNFVPTPEIVYFEANESPAFLVLEYIEAPTPSPKFWENFGHTLAQLHRQSQGQFGLDHHNFIGSLPQTNHLHDSWASFYRTERLQAQLDLALSNQAVPPIFQDYFNRLYTKIDQLCPAEVPALIHGDLWSGNFMVGNNEQVLLIDPSVAYAHREMDLAMSRLFGGFAPRFYEAYEEAFPCEVGLEDRLPIYQLYYLMVHVNLFGGSYLASVKRILDRFI